MNDLPVLVAVAFAVFACLYMVWSLDRPVPRIRIGRWGMRRIVEVR